MNRLISCDLVYINQSQDENGNPVITPYKKTVKATQMDSFSLNYYLNQQRDMRASKNIVIARPYTEPLNVDGSLYRLEYVDLNNVKYKIRNILLNKKSAITSILDVQEVMSD